MFKILDWYIIRKFVSTYVFAIIALSVIIVVFDLGEKIDDFVEKKAPLSAIVFDYYFNFVPFLLSMFSALFTFIAVILVTSNLAGHTEIIAMFSNGISLGRVLRPYLLVAAVITLGNMYLTNIMIPQANTTRHTFEALYWKNPYYNSDRHIHRQLQPGLFLYIHQFNVSDQIAYKFSLEKLEEGRLVSKLTSAYARWDSTAQTWKIHNYVLRTKSEKGETIETGISLDTTILLTGKDFSTRATWMVEDMDYWQLEDYIESLRMQGSTNVTTALIEKHKRIAYPMASFVLTVIGVSVSSRKMRHGTGLHLLVGVSLSFAYILFQRFSEMFVQVAALSPLQALWLPNVLFGIVAVVLYVRTPK